MLLKDIQPDLRLTVSDKRAGILHNLTERFRNYHHRQPEKIVTDVTDEEILKKQLKGRTFDHIICDVPCSGSGTWARTPEQAFFFKELSLDRYTTWQQQITVNAFRYLKKGGRMIYITCSVFEKENEAVIRYFLQHSSAALISSRLINGINNKADSMFIAVLQK